jgi:hypothetical protein
MHKIRRSLLASTVAIAAIGAAVAPLAAGAAAPLISWAPSTTVNATTMQPRQMIMVRRGQTQTYTVTFKSTTALTNVQVKRTLSAYAQKNGVQMTVLSTSLGNTTALAANTPASVSFSVSAAANAFVATYNADLHVNGSVNGGAMAHQPNDFDFTIRVGKMAQVISWAAKNTSGISEGPNDVIGVRQGHSTIRTGSFTSNVALTNVKVMRTLRDYARDHGVVVKVLSTSLGSATTLAAGTPVLVTFSVSAAANTRVATYHTDVHVDGSINGSVQTFLPNSLPLIVAVGRA